METETHIAAGDVAAPALAAEKVDLQPFFSPLFANTGGIDSWLCRAASDDVASRLRRIDRDPLSRSQLNQLLVLSNEAGLSEGFFSYYWLEAPDEHPYDVESVPGFDNRWFKAKTELVSDLGHLKWGFYRFYVDALLYFGNVRSAYRFLRDLDSESLAGFYAKLRMPTEAMTRRGATLPLREIPEDDRYLISEMACKSLAPPRHGDVDVDELLKGETVLKAAVLGAYNERGAERARNVTWGDLLGDDFVSERFGGRRMQLELAATELLNRPVESRDQLEADYAELERAFTATRTAALENTRLYLSMIEELDVYVATSMRTKEDFISMARFCDYVFNQPQLSHLHLRYFDPTLSAAEGHEDKGLIECLTVKCAKVLVYSAGAKESWGKDAEAAMALSLGKPVIFYCDDNQRQLFYRDVHPLSRLIDFKSGVPVGAIVTSSRDEVVELLARIFENRMQYEIEQRIDPEGDVNTQAHLRLKEKLTKSVVRLQTSDELLRETFWNYYHRTPPDTETGLPGVGVPRVR